MNSKIAGVGYYVPEKIVTNNDLKQYMDTTDEWIQERTGIRERRYAEKHKETATTMATEAAIKAIDNAGISKEDIDFIIFATISPDYYFPGCGVLLQRELGITKSTIGALDVRNQCSGFVYALSVADKFVKTGTYKNILVVGSEMHSMGLDYSTRGRGVSVIFGDGAGAVIVQPTEDESKGILTTHLHSDGSFAEELALINPGCHGGYHDEDKEKYGFVSPEIPGEIFVTQAMIDNHLLYPYMNGQLVFKNAIVRFKEVIMEALETAQLEPEDLDMFIPHQANLRISQYIQKTMGLSDDQVYNNIQKYGNTTAASIPIALAEACGEGKVKEGDLVCLAAFGSGFTWGSALIRW